MEISNVDRVGRSGGKPTPIEIECSVCLEPVDLDSVERSVAMLKCGHHFHLNCIGSAFNAKGCMQCPYCRDIEHENWLYANGSTFNHDDDDISFEDDEDIHSISSQPHMIESVTWPTYQEVPVFFGDDDTSLYAYADATGDVLYANPSPFVPDSEIWSAMDHPRYEEEPAIGAWSSTYEHGYGAFDYSGHETSGPQGFMPFHDVGYATSMLVNDSSFPSAASEEIQQHTIHASYFQGEPYPLGPSLDCFSMGGVGTAMHMNCELDEGMLPWAASEAESEMWTWYTNPYYGAEELTNNAFRTPSLFPGYSSTFEHENDGSRGVFFSESTSS